MAAAADAFSCWAPPAAAPELFDYPQFTACAVPEGSGAVAACKGFIRPFSDDATARRTLRAIERDIPLRVSGGRVDVDLPEIQDHHLDDYIVDMALPFTILVLEFADAAHPQAFLLDPPMIPRLTACAHLRPDKLIHIDDHPYPALCVYSGTLQRFDGSRSRLEQFLDQAATYLAKYLIWLRTRALYRRTPEGPKLIRPGRPQRHIASAEIQRDPTVFCDGYWPGRVAPSGPDQHLATIRPGEECWCWSGDSYGNCCRPHDIELLSRLQREWMCAQFVRKLMAAVHGLSAKL